MSVETETTITHDQLVTLEGCEIQNRRDAFRDIFEEARYAVLLETVRFCDRHNLSVEIRGSWLDKKLLHSNNMQDRLNQATNDLEDETRIVGDCSNSARIQEDQLVPNGALDIKIHGATSQDILKELYAYLQSKVATFESQNPKPELISFNSKFAAAHNHFKPKTSVDLTFSSISETTAIQAIALVYKQEILSLTNPVLKGIALYKADDPWFPVKLFTQVLGATYITCMVDETKHIDRSSPDRTTNIDALSTKVTMTGNDEILLEIPEIPDEISFSDTAKTYYQKEVLANLNMLAMERFVEIVVRSMRKGKTFSRNFSSDTASFITECVNTIATHWTSERFPHNEIRTKFHNQELDVAVALDPTQTLMDIYSLHLYKLMHPLVAATFSSLHDIKISQIYLELIQRPLSRDSGFKRFDQSMRHGIITPVSYHDQYGVYIFYSIHCPDFFYSHHLVTSTDIPEILREDRIFPEKILFQL